MKQDDLLQAFHAKTDKQKVKILLRALDAKTDFRTVQESILFGMGYVRSIDDLSEWVK